MRKGSRIVTWCDLYILLWCLYNLQGIAYEGGIVNTVLHSLMLLLSAVVSLKYVFSFFSNHSFIKSTLLLLFVFVVYGLLFKLSGKVLYLPTGETMGKYTYILNALDSLLPIVLFYDYANKGLLTADRIRIYLFVLLSVSIVDYSFSRAQIIRETAGFEGTNNSSYNIVSLFPLLFFVRKNYLRYVLAIIMLSFVLLSFKRGAIIIGVFSLLLIILLDFKKRRSQKLEIAFFGLLMVGITVVMFNDLLSTNSYFIERVNDTIAGDSNGRDMIAELIWDTVMNHSDITQILVGHGANSTLEYANHLAHNDWLEVLCNNGLLGVVFLAMFFLQAFLMTRSLKRNEDASLYNSGFLLFFIAFTETLFSMSIVDLHISQCLLWGFLCYSSVSHSTSTSVLKS